MSTSDPWNGWNVDCTEGTAECSLKAQKLILGNKQLRNSDLKPESGSRIF
jgi:hypothetical protein